MTFQKYRRSQIAELADWSPDTDMEGVSVSQADKDAGSPKAGDKIARNPKNHADRWLVAAAYFADNFEPVAAVSGPARTPEAPAPRINTLLMEAALELSDPKATKTSEQSRAYRNIMEAIDLNAARTPEGEPEAWSTIRRGLDDAQRLGRDDSLTYEQMSARIDALAAAIENKLYRASPPSPGEHK